jgi:nitric oxide reductase subunit B
MQHPTLQTIRWLRAIGDTVFAIGAVALAWFILGLKTGWSVREPVGARVEEQIAA